MTDDSLLTIAVAKILIKHYPICFDDKSIKAIQADLIDKFEKSVQGNWYAGWGADFLHGLERPFRLKNHIIHMVMVQRCHFTGRLAC